MIREPIERWPDRPRDNNELARLKEHGDFSTATMERMAELFGQNGPEWPPAHELDS